jgi:Coenzyme PQQ synthesis protein D (PqqD)
MENTDMVIGPKVSHECVDGEVIAINMDNGTYYSIRDFGADLWQLIDAGWNRDEVVALVTGEYCDSAAAAVSLFLDELVVEGLVIDTAAPERLRAVELPVSFSTPRLEKFTDLQELLMLDPIHEVGISGWPHKPA